MKKPMRSLPFCSQSKHNCTEHNPDFISHTKKVARTTSCAKKSLPRDFCWQVTILLGKKGNIARVYNLHNLQAVPTPKFRVTFPGQLSRVACRSFPHLCMWILAVATSRQQSRRILPPPAQRAAAVVFLVSGARWQALFGKQHHVGP